MLNPANRRIAWGIVEQLYINEADQHEEIELLNGGLVLKPQPEPEPEHIEEQRREQEAPRRFQHEAGAAARIVGVIKNTVKNEKSPRFHGKLRSHNWKQKPSILIWRRT